jgi:hypothetical protein
MNQRLRDPLDRALGSLPRDIPPERDLWSQIEAEIAASPRPMQNTPTLNTMTGFVDGRIDSPIDSRIVELPVRRRFAVSSRWMQMAAGVLLIVASSFTTWVIVQRSVDQKVLQAQQTTVQQMQPVLNAMPASFGGSEGLGADYLKARAQLSAEFEQRIAELPPVTRARLERDLADLRRAANQVAVTLGEHPDDPLLQQLLLSTYQSELALLGSVGKVSPPVMGANL